MTRKYRVTASVEYDVVVESGEAVPDRVAVKMAKELVNLHSTMAGEGRAFRYASQQNFKAKHFTVTPIRQNRVPRKPKQKQ